MAESITELTRRNIMDGILSDDADWSGRLSDAEFLSRLYDLDDLPSTDRRFPTARGDIETHTNAFHDWERDWVFHDSRFNLFRAADSELLEFLCATLHPLVRSADGEADRLAAMYNRHLAHDGWELRPTDSISGRPIFSAFPMLGQAPDAEALRAATARVDRGGLARNITRLFDGCVRDPDQAIGQAKTLVEGVCKTIIEERTGTPAPDDLDFTQLARRTRELLQLLPESVPADDASAEDLRALLGQLSAIVARLGSLRNSFGDGHGRAASSAGLEARHGRLAAYAAVGLATFLFETHEASRAAEGEDPF